MNAHLALEKESKNTAKGIAWNLDDLYQGQEDPRLHQDLEAVRKEAQAFVSLFKGKIRDHSLEAQTLLTALQAYESIHVLGMKPYAFAYLFHACDVLDPKRNDLFQKVQEAWNEILEMITFFPLEIMALPENTLRKLEKDDALKDYRHFLFQQTKLKPHALSEPEETIIQRMRLSGRMALVSLYDEFMASLQVVLEVEGQVKSFSAQQVLSLLHEPDRSLRENAYETLLEELGRQSLVLRNIINALLLDHRLETLKRGHPSPMHRVCITDGVDEGIIGEMMEVVEAHYPLARRYLSKKAALLGLDKLDTTDLWAPLNAEGMQVPWSKARGFVLEAMETFHPLFYSIAYEFFEKNWIDAESRKGKRSGAFCRCFAPSQHPFVLMNYSGNLRDLAILAHELGHGIHYKLASRNSFLGFDPSPVLAETASTFSEILLIQHLLKSKALQTQRPALLLSHLDGIMVTVYRQNVLTRFEQAVHRERQNQLLSTEEICQLWWEENERLYGEEVEMIPAYRWGWAHVPHFIHHPFYCYSYIFGNLLTIVLYQHFQNNGEDFSEKIISLLSAGASQTPMEMLAQLGLDPAQKSLWEQAFHYVEKLIEALEAFGMG
jgi:oligoendopeptidase F